MEDLSDIRITFVESTEQFLEFLRWLGRSRSVLCVDTETAGLEWWRHPLRLVQIGDRDTAWCFRWPDWKGAVKDVLERYDGELTGHNIKFDAHMLQHNGVEWTAKMWGRSHDTRVMAHLHEPWLATGLKSVTQRLINEKASVGEALLQKAMSTQGWEWGTIPVDYPAYWMYGGLDTILGARAYDILRSRIPAELYEVERKVQYSVWKMENRGAHVDLNFCEIKARELEAYVRDATDWVRTTFGCSATSNVQVIEVLQRLGIELTKLTKSGTNYALDEEVLEPLATQHELPRTVLAIRKAHKIANTYLRNFIDFADDYGVLHPDVNTLGARTGRMGVGRPALQTLQRGKGPVRDAFTSRYPDGRIVLVDYDQIEMRIYAVLSEDEQLCAAFGSEDFFTTAARQIFQDPNLGKNDERRQHLKNARYARNYGAGTQKIALTIGLPVEDVELIEARWTELYPKAARFPNIVNALGRQRREQEGVAYVRTPMGRLEVAVEKGDYVLTNYLIQGAAADVFKKAIVRCDEAGLDEWMVMPVHDELVLDVPSDIAEEVAQLTQKTMRDDELSVPLTTGYDIVERWGDKYL